MFTSWSITLMLVVRIGATALHTNTPCSSWTDLKSIISSADNATVTLDPAFTSNYDSEITISGKKLIIFGNGAVIDAGGKGRMFNLANGASLELHSLTLQNGKV